MKSFSIEETERLIQESLRQTSRGHMYCMALCSFVTTLYRLLPQGEASEEFVDYVFNKLFYLVVALTITGVFFRYAGKGVPRTAWELHTPIQFGAGGVSAPMAFTVDFIVQVAAIGYVSCVVMAVFYMNFGPHRYLFDFPLLMMAARAFALPIYSTLSFVQPTVALLLGALFTPAVVALLIVMAKQWSATTGSHILLAFAAVAVAYLFRFPMAALCRHSYPRCFVQNQSAAIE